MEKVENKLHGHHASLVAVFSHRYIMWYVMLCSISIRLDVQGKVTLIECYSIADGRAILIVDN